MSRPIQSWSRRHLDKVIFAGAAFHTVSGLLATEGSIADLIREGWFGSMNPGYAPASGETFWFTFTGISLFVSGFLVRSQLRATGTLPESFGWSFVVIGLLIGTAMPASGAWLILAVGLLALAIRRPAERPISSASTSIPRPEYGTSRQ